MKCLGLVLRARQGCGLECGQWCCSASVDCGPTVCQALGMSGLTLQVMLTAGASHLAHWPAPLFTIKLIYIKLKIQFLEGPAPSPVLVAP